MNLPFYLQKRVMLYEKTVRMVKSQNPLVVLTSILSSHSLFVLAQNSIKCCGRSINSQIIPLPSKLMACVPDQRGYLGRGILVLVQVRLSWLARDKVLMTWTHI